MCCLFNCCTLLNKDNEISLDKLTLEALSVAGWVQSTGGKGLRLNRLKMKEKHISIFINLGPPLGHETLSLKGVTSVLFVVYPHL